MTNSVRSSIFLFVVAGLAVLGIIVERHRRSGFCVGKFKKIVIGLTALQILYGTTTGLCLAQNWFPTSAPQQTWSSIALSSDGNKLVAVSSAVPNDSNGYIFTSTNGGSSWTQTSAPFDHWVCTASSSDGGSLVAAASYLNGPIYRSSDAGVTWILTSAPGQEWRNIASSADGNVLVAGTYNGVIYVSTDSGSTWQQRLSAGNYGLVSCSSLGDRLVAAGGGVYFSTNYGATWSKATNAPALIWSDLATSTNGDVIALVGGKSLITSTNMGATWSSNNLANMGTGPIALSGDAKTLTMAIAKAICSSTNLGTTWVTNNAPNNITWDTVATSSDGSRLAAAGYDQIFVSPFNPMPKSSVVAWGRGLYGQATVPATATNVIAIAGSEYNSLALRNDGTVLAWGYNNLGQTNVPGELTNVVSIAASRPLSLALRNDGTVGWWGWSSFTNNIPSLSNVVAIAASDVNFYLAVQSNGLVTAWGVNTDHQTNVPAGLSNVVSVAVGDYHSLALRNDGTVAAWGSSGQTNMPPGLSNVVAIAAGVNFSLAVKRDGSLVGWPTNQEDIVMKIPAGLSNVVSVAADDQHALALTRDGTVWAWGTVGLGYFNYQVGLPNLVAIACGDYHSLAITGDGKPQVIQQPWAQKFFAGFSTYMYAGAVGVPPLSYQWQLNGINVDGATNALLNLTNIQAANAGNYVLTVSNSLGMAVSSNARLTVLTNPPTFILQPSNQTVMTGSNVTFSIAIGAGPMPNTYQWQFNGNNIVDATNSFLTLTNVQTANQGNYWAVVNNGYGTVTSSTALLTMLDLPTALNSTGLTWSTSGSAAWFAQTNISHDGFQAAQSGVVANGQSSALQTTVTGPGTLTFWWMFAPSTSPFFNTLSFSSSQGNNSASVGVTSGWQQKTFYLGVGQQTLTWTYSRHAFSSAQSTGRVDEVSFTPGGTPPTITSMSPNAYVRANSNVAFAVGAYGTAPLVYQWQLNGTNLSNKTNASLSLTSVQVTNAGIYTVIITNSVGTVATNAALWAGQFGLSTSSTNLFMSPDGFQLKLDGILTTNPVVIFGSTDLVSWLPLFTNPATTGSVQFLDMAATNASARFYRAQE
ncbi:MAG: Immunoglobulin I-set domain protein [Verrucomicrobiales bacterium]|nr:Immunoglobulin I-set domain protein [Verrucomicrobiales bacterium]